MQKGFNEWQPWAGPMINNSSNFQTDSKIVLFSNRIQIDTHTPKENRKFKIHIIQYNRKSSIEQEELLLHLTKVITESYINKTPPHLCWSIQLSQWRYQTFSANPCLCHIEIKSTWSFNKKFFWIIRGVSTNIPIKCRTWR